MTSQIFSFSSIIVYYKKTITNKNSFWKPYQRYSQMEFNLVVPS